MMLEDYWRTVLAAMLWCLGWAWAFWMLGTW